MLIRHSQRPQYYQFSSNRLCAGGITRPSKNDPVRIGTGDFPMTHLFVSCPWTRQAPRIVQIAIKFRLFINKQSVNLKNLAIRLELATLFA